MSCGSSMLAMIFSSPPQRVQLSISTSNTRFNRRAQLIATCRGVETLAGSASDAGGRGAPRPRCIAAEFPRTDAHRSGLTRSYTLHATSKAAQEPLFTGVALHDWQTGRSRRFDFGPDHLVEEMVFVPYPGSRTEMDGWILGPSINLRAGKTELHVFDARHIADGPICTWQAPVALPLSLHGAFAKT